MGPIEVLQALVAEGVEFTTDGKMVRWRYSDGWMKPEVVSILLAGKAEVIAYLQTTVPGPIDTQP